LIQATIKQSQSNTTTMDLNTDSDGEDDALLQWLLNDEDEDNFVTIATVFNELKLARDEEDSNLRSKQYEARRKRKFGGSEKGKFGNKKRNFDLADEQLRSHYFNGEKSLYNEKDFETRFGMPRSVFLTIYEMVKEDKEFKRKVDCTGKPGITALCRITAVCRYLKYGSAADREDEYLQQSETVVLRAVKVFTRLIVLKFGMVYLNRCPTMEEKIRMEKMMARSGFPGIFGSWDCKHFKWCMCPLREAGQFKGKEKNKTIILEIVSDRDGYIWFSFFGEPGSLNDINILNKSTIVTNLVNGTFDMSVDKFQVGKVQRDFLGFLADGIYPDWSIFLRTIGAPFGDRECKYAKQHEFVRKDVERGFGKFVKVFQACDRPFRLWYREDICSLLNCCIILHNMTVETRRHNFKYNNVVVDIPESADVCGPNEKKKHSLFMDDDGGVHGEDGVVDFASPAHKVSTVYHNMTNEIFYKEYFTAMVDHIHSKFFY
jgi:hypothetical protein